LAVDFMSADLTEAILIIVICIVLNLKKRLPTKPILEAVIITIDPARKLKSTIFYHLV
jgi:hypothetical protein